MTTPLYQGTGGHNYIQDEENEVIQTLEEMKKKARELAITKTYQNYDGKKLNYTFKEEHLDTLIEQVWNARTEEVETIAEQVASRLDGRTVSGHEQFRAMVKEEITKAFTPPLSNNN